MTVLVDAIRGVWCSRSSSGRRSTAPMPGRSRRDTTRENLVGRRTRLRRQLAHRGSPGLAAAPVQREPPCSHLAGRARRRNPHAPAHAGRQRWCRRQRRRRNDRRRRIGSLVNTLTLIGVLRGHVPIGVTDIHVPRHRVVNVILGQVQQRITWAPMIWAVAQTVDLRGRRAVINRLGGTCAQAHAGETHTAGHQHSRCEPDDYSFHRIFLSPPSA
jgi:hypothetical protein